MAAKPESKKRIDIRFVITACAIGTAYAAVIVFIERLVGKEAAGVAAVALTALATGIFKEFETLHFRRATDGESRLLMVPATSATSFVMLLLVFAGSHGVVSQLFDSLALGLSLQLPNVEDGMILRGLLTHPSFWGWPTLAVITLGSAYLIAAFCIGRVLQPIRYSVIAIAAMSGAVMTELVPAALAIAFLLARGLSDLVWWESPQFFTPVFYPVYILFAVAGAKLARLSAQPSGGTERGDSLELSLSPRDPDVDTEA